MTIGKKMIFKQDVFIRRITLYKRILLLFCKKYTSIDKCESINNDSIEITYMHKILFGKYYLIKAEYKNQ
jgi:glucan phosphorylase